jgi:hypothetical protein
MPPIYMPQSLMAPIYMAQSLMPQSVMSFLKKFFKQRAQTQVTFFQTSFQKMCPNTTTIVFVLKNVRNTCSNKHKWSCFQKKSETHVLTHAQTVVFRTTIRTKRVQTRNMFFCFRTHVLKKCNIDLFSKNVPETHAHTRKNVFFPKHFKHTCSVTKQRFFNLFLYYLHICSNSIQTFLLRDMIVFILFFHISLTHNSVIYIYIYM